ncbi:hypothetical protein Tco_0803464 [Tanacetum coccineum]|uniref:Uncharacterized protein n=1 Tax=Tanacetum coccineum TaxID=301880 RepID=A0ABQ5A4D3_9ASTR
MMVQAQAQMGEDEAVYKELDDSLVRAATTASSLEVEQDSGNITKTQSKATLNEPSSLGTSSGGSRNFHTLKRLYRIGATARVESSKDREDLDEEASKQERISNINVDARITLVSTHFDADTDMFGVHDLVGDEVVVESEIAVKAGEKRNVVKEVVAATITDDEITLAQSLAELKSAKPKADKVVI